MGLSVNEFTYAGDDEFNLNFALGYASQGDVSAYVKGTDPIEELTFDWLNNNKVRLTPGHGLTNGEVIVFRRTVSKQQLPVDLGQPGKATRENLQLLSTHIMYSLHEVLDGRIADSVLVEDVILQAVEDAVNAALASLGVTLQQFEQLFFGFYNTFDGQKEYIVTARPATCEVDDIEVDVQTNPSQTVEFLISNGGQVKATVQIAPNGTVTRSIPGGGTTFVLAKGQTTCEISTGTADATLECGITVIGGVDVSDITS
ncbi:hypothetical protein ParaKuw1_00010 [Paracoccus phage ParKuw1]|uniref:Uncharacterized protein n=1 Tax=Paracoccus phage ParKuw1 TaxID=3032415 RepID=A0AAF0JQ48_9CAUD|nr:hypothetical protein ParaKuw1_00010 [Paracoccus phage ParKuw1]